MTMMTKRSGAAGLLGVLAMTVSLGYCGGMEELRAGTAGFEAGMDIKEMIGAQQLELAAPQPAAAESAAVRDVFMEVQACIAVDWSFTEGRPTTQYALKRLAPCMEGLSGIYGNKIYAEATIMNPDDIRIVVLDSVSGKTIAEDLEASLAKRDGRLYGHAVTLAVMDVSWAQKKEKLRQIREKLDKIAEDMENDIRSIEAAKRRISLL